MTDAATDVTPTAERAIGPAMLEQPGGLSPLGPPSALEALHARELDVQIMTARKYPRSLATFRARSLTLVKLDAETAASCYYALPRRQRQDDGSVKRITITGPSVRLAELVATAWGNLRAGARIVAETSTEVIAQGYCHDLETNNAIVMEVQRRIVDRDGRRYSEDLVLLTKNAACAIARRNAIFAIIPRAFVNPLVEVAKKVAAGEAKTLPAMRTAALAAFKELGVSTEQVCEKLERRGIDDIDLEDLALLSGLLTAIRDNETTVAAEFAAPPPGPSAATSLQETVARRRRALGPDEAEKKPEEKPAG